ncbi:MAG: twin-arginine translocase subunit TatC [Bryobacterales bacterium]
MNSDEKEPQGQEPGDNEDSSTPAEGGERKAPEGAIARGEESTSEAEPKPPSKSTYYDDPYDEYDYQHDTPKEETAVVKAESEPAKTPPPPPPPTTDLDDDEDDEEDGMARMSFLEHLEELRTRIFRAIIGMVVGYIVCFAFNGPLFTMFEQPFHRAAEKLPYDPPLSLITTEPTEQFYIQYIKLPLLAAIFVGAPWLMFQAWAFIAPGLYKRERKWAIPFIFSTAGLFITGGLFCYFIALRFALAFLIGLGYDVNVRPMIKLTSYYDMFFNLHVGLGVVFQMPIVIVFFTLLRITTPGFLLANVRYAILIIFILAAVITPTPDVTTMLTFAAPMILLFYVGIGGSYLIVLNRENRKFPWAKFLLALLGIAAGIALIVAFLHFNYGYELLDHWPYLAPPEPTAG